MKQASSFEIVAARCWNLLNEGKPFTPIFVIGVFALYRLDQWTDGGFWIAVSLSLILMLPLFAIYYHYDFPLFLRNYLWLPVVVALLIWEPFNLSLYVIAIGLYVFFTVFFWGTLYYHLRIGTSWWNFKRFWKLVLKNSDSTSGNAQEQLPKLLILLFLWNHFYSWLESAEEQSLLSVDVANTVVPLYVFMACVWLYAWILHSNLFDWKPTEASQLTVDPIVTGEAVNEKVIVIVVDGMRKERFEDADAPFLKKLRAEGTEYTQMETVYPARTVVCFSSMFTGAYPKEHGIRSNMVWRLGIRVESIFDSLRKVGKKGRLLGIAHLIDSMGDDVESVTAVMHNDIADRNIIERAKRIMADQNPDLLVVQLIGVDQTGHSRGVLYDEYVHKINEADKLIEEYVGWLTVQGMMRNTTLIICADHGQADGIGGHGHLDEGERFVPFFLHGPAIKQGYRVMEKHSLISMAPTLAYLLGTPYPNGSRGQVLTDSFIPRESSDNGRKEAVHERNEQQEISRLHPGA